VADAQGKRLDRGGGRGKNDKRIPYLKGRKRSFHRKHLTQQITRKRGRSGGFLRTLRTKRRGGAKKRGNSCHCRWLMDLNTRIARFEGEGKESSGDTLNTKKPKGDKT